MKKRGCEIEAKGINYHIEICKRAHPFKIWSRDDDDDGGGAGATAAEKINGGDGPAQCHEGDVPTRSTHLRPKYRIRQVLRNVSCHAKPSEILAIVGPSGAGKSTLLEILAGKLSPPSPPEILINHKPIDKSHFRRISGYVTQTDVLFPLLTVRETLAFSARLRLGARAAAPPAPLLSSRVDSLIRELGLERAADTRVSAVSGGERRRVSIGVEAVHDPQVLVLDEPTSGLDSTSALQIVDMLRAMAESRGRTIILSIHQPGFRIVKLFGAVLLLADGAALYHGTVDQLSAHLLAVGLQRPVHVNVVEFAIDSIDSLHQHQRRTLQDPPAQIAKKKDRCTLQQLFLTHNHKVADDAGCADIAGSLDYANSRPREIAILTHRFFKNVSRTRQLFACRTVAMLVSGLLLGSIFYNLDGGKLGERVGLFAFILTFLLSSTTEALPIFLQEREILMRETSCGSYRVSSYVIANALVFLPFLLILATIFAVPVYWLVGLRRSLPAFAYFLLLIWLVLYTANSVVVCFSALAPNFIVGNSVISGVMGSFFLFSGYFITKEAMPGCWVFMHYVSLFKYPFEGFLVNEFSGSARCAVEEGGACVATAGDVLREEGLGEQGRWRNVGVMVAFIVVYRFFSYLILRCRCRCAQKGGLRRSLSSS